MAKRNNDHLSLSEVLKAFVETNKLDKGIDKIQVQNAWSDLWDLELTITRKK